MREREWERGVNMGKGVGGKRRRGGEKGAMKGRGGSGCEREGVVGFVRSQC